MKTDTARDWSLQSIPCTKLFKDLSFGLDLIVDSPSDLSLWVFIFGVFSFVCSFPVSLNFSRLLRSFQQRVRSLRERDGLKHGAIMLSGTSHCGDLWNFTRDLQRKSVQTKPSFGGRQSSPPPYRPYAKFTKKKSLTAPFNNMRTIKFKAQPTNTYFATVNQKFGGSSQLPTMLCEPWSTIWFDYRALGSSRKLGGVADTFDWRQRETYLSVDLWILESACYWKAQ